MIGISITLMVFSIVLIVIGLYNIRRFKGSCQIIRNKELLINMNKVTVFLGALLFSVELITLILAVIRI